LRRSVAATPTYTRWAGGSKASTSRPESRHLDD
jgi:hypothetical protein